MCVSCASSGGVTTTVYTPYCIRSTFEDRLSSREFLFRDVFHKRNDCERPGQSGVICSTINQHSGDAVSETKKLRNSAPWEEGIWIQYLTKDEDDGERRRHVAFSVPQEQRLSDPNKGGECVLVISHDSVYKVFRDGDIDRFGSSRRENSFSFLFSHTMYHLYHLSTAVFYVNRRQGSVSAYLAAAQLPPFA